jgi:hypothetical protein
LLVSFTLVGLSGQIIAQTKRHRLNGRNGVWQGLYASGIHSTHSFYHGEKAVDLVQHALALLRLEF